MDVLGEELVRRPDIHDAGPSDVPKCTGFEFPEVDTLFNDKLPFLSEFCCVETLPPRGDTGSERLSNKEKAAPAPSAVSLELSYCTSVELVSSADCEEDNGFEAGDTAREAR